MARFKVGYHFFQQDTTMAELRRMWQDADRMGVDSIWPWDHFFPIYGNPRATSFEGWSLLAAMAVDTERADLGMLVTGNPYRNPDLLADMARTVDHLSGGRAVLGIGAGWFQRDFDEYGYDFGTVGTRLSLLEDAMPRIEARMGKLNPPPVRQPIPILIGGGGVKRTLKLVARHANIWHSFGSPEVVSEKSEILREHCANEGRDPAEIEISWGAQNGDWDELRGVGVTHFILGVSGSDTGYDLGRLGELVAWRDAL